MKSKVKYLFKNHTTDAIALTFVLILAICVFIAILYQTVMLYIEMPK